MLRLLSRDRDPYTGPDGPDDYEAPRPVTSHCLDARLPNSPSQYKNFSRKFMPPATSGITTYIVYKSDVRLTNVDFDPIPHLTKTPWEVERHKKHSAHRRSNPRSEFPAYVFKRLPKEVYNCILQQLELLHLGSSSDICPSCYMNDLYNLSLTSRAWDTAAAEQLYRKIWVLTDSTHLKMQKLKHKSTSRLKLLRRTLRENPSLARYVRELHMGDFQVLYQNAKWEEEQQDVVDMVASLVMACPNLERLSGFHIPYTQTFDRLSYALSTRRKLKERIWLLSSPPLTGFDSEPDSSEDQDPSQDYYLAANDPTEQFLDLHSKHPHLTTLVIDATHLPTEVSFRALIGSIKLLPSLIHLSLSNLPRLSFIMRHLLALPPTLLSLRLENLRGLTDTGLQRFASSLLVTNLQNLSLIDLEFRSLLTLSKFLSPDLPSLKRFTISQSRCPTALPHDDLPTPLFQSRTLEYLHWDITTNPTPINALLAESIQSHTLPRLSRLRAPTDINGTLQSLCKPCVNLTLPRDYTLHTGPISPLDLPTSAKTSFESRPDSVISTSSTAELASYLASELEVEIGEARICRLRKARLEAQRRICEARKRPVMLLAITNPEGVVVKRKSYMGFMGDMGSRVVYDLGPDVEGGDTAVVGVGDVTGLVEGGGGWEEGKLGCRHAGRMRRSEVDVGLLF